MNPWYKDYAEYLTRFFGDTKVQKISVNTGAGCPNRDGTVGTGGCIYCNNRSFTPDYCMQGDGIRSQIEAGKRFFGRKYPQMKYLAYFQSYTNTHRQDADSLRRDYEEAISAKDVVGLIVGTRPDSLPEEVVSLLAEINHRVPVFVELGVESMHDETLLVINRGHDSAATRDATRRLADAGLHVGVHLIAGLPGEDDRMFLQTLREVCALPIESVKLHHLQVLRDTTLARRLERGDLSVKLYSPAEYLELCMKALEVIPRSIAIERFLASAPPQMVISPKWGLKNYQFVNLLHNRLAEKGR